MKMQSCPVGSRTVRYSWGVTTRRLLLAAMATVVLTAGPASTALAQTKPNAEAARGAAQAAKAVSDAADELADSTVAPIDDGAPKSKVENARDGVVTLERAGKVLGIGAVLAGDGRILTALSPLTHGNNVDARFADGSVTRIKVGHTDRAWDLALLIPQNGRWKKGLRASRKSATELGSHLRVFSLVGAKELAPARTIVKGQRTLLGGDNELLHDALEIASRLKSTDLGSPILDDKGDVVGVVARACAPGENQVCSQVPFGVPTTAVKAFLRTVPASAVPPAPWLGIQGAADASGPARGVRVVSVHPKSPAAAGGLAAASSAPQADVVVAVDGVPVTSPEALAETINQRAVGDSVELLVLGRGKYRRVSLTLQPAPGSKPQAALAAAPPARPAPAKPPRR